MRKIAIVGITALLEADRDSYGHICIHDLHPEFTLVEEGEWTQEHKHQQAYHIVRHDGTGRHFGLAQSRSGSYHSDWYYDATKIAEVHKVTETIVVDKWVVV